MQRFPQSVIIRGPAHHDIFAQRFAEKTWHLGRVRAAGRCEEGGGVGDGVTVPDYRTCLRRQQAEHGAQQGSLTRTYTPGNHSERACLYAEVDICYAFGSVSIPVSQPSHLQIGERIANAYVSYTVGSLFVLDKDGVMLVEGSRGGVEHE